jgi:hypothetical protein
VEYGCAGYWRGEVEVGERFGVTKDGRAVRSPLGETGVFALL